MQWTRPLPWPPASPLPLLLPPLPLPLPLLLLPFTESTCSLWTRGLVALFLELPFPLDPGRTAPGTAWWEWAWLPPWWEWELEWPWEWPWPSFFAAFALSSTGGLEPFVAAVVAEGKEVLLLLLLLAVAFLQQAHALHGTLQCILVVIDSVQPANVQAKVEGGVCKRR